MSAILSLPLDPTAVAPALFWDEPITTETPTLRPQRIRRHGPVLHASPFDGPEDVLSLNLSNGCVHRCAFCCVRGRSDLPTRDGELFADTAVQLERELDSRSQLPKAVYISPGSDPFPPQLNAQEEAVAVVEVLARRGVTSWLMTRGYIRPRIRQRLAVVADRIKVTIGLTTMDRQLQRLLEPYAAPSRSRIRQIARLRQAGVPVQVSLEPLIPGLTDTRANLVAVLETLAGVGVRHVLAGYLFLRPAIREKLVEVLAHHKGWDETVLEAYENGPFLRSGGVKTARYLPLAYRQRGYAALMALGASYGISVGINGATNADFPRRGRRR